MRELLEGLVPGLPEELADAGAARGPRAMPLYAVETVRMLLDRGLLTQEGSRYRVTGDVGELDVPETLHALAAARLDGLTAERAGGAPGRRRCSGSRSRRPGWPRCRSARRRA